MLPPIVLHDSGVGVSIDICREALSLGGQNAFVVNAGCLHILECYNRLGLFVGAPAEGRRK